MSATTVPHIEYSFATGDRVDVMFENHLPDRTAVELEVEVEGENELCIGHTPGDQVSVPGSG
jgi:hypothetical protein